MTIVRGYLAALAVLGVLDALWLGLVARGFYKARLGPLLRARPVWPIAMLFYLIHAAGIAAFPAQLAGGSLPAAALYGALFGLCVYAAYDLTNLATLHGWTAALSLVDLAWGTAVTAAAATASSLAMSSFS